MEKLSLSFDECKSGKVASSELSQIIYRFTKGPAKDIYGKCDDAVADTGVASAIRTGILKKDELLGELFDHLAHLIRF